MNIDYECRWTVKHWRKGKIIWEIVDKKNILVNEGEKAILDTFFRNNASTYISSSFYIGMYNGSIAETTTLATIPNEPASLYGYSRQVIERSSVGWPTIELNDGDWRITSKEIEYEASGGNIGPVNGIFLGTSLNNSGTLISSLAFGVERTVIAGDSMTVFARVKLK